MSNAKEHRGLVRLVLWLHSMSVFKTTKSYSMNDAMAMMFHRLAASTYFTYAAWAILVLFVGTPSLNQQGSLFAVLLPVAVFLTATPACIGAVFFPHAARLELFSGSVFTMLMLIYMSITAQGAITGVVTWSSVVLILAITIMPACRTAMIIYFLIKQAKIRDLGRD